MTSSPPRSSSRPTDAVPRVLVVAGVLACATALVSVVLAQPAAPSPVVGSVSGTVVIFKDGKRVTDYSTVVVYIKNVKDPPKTPRPKPMIRQKNQTYTPRLTVVPVGTTIGFPNDDRVEHSVFSPYTGPDYFDLGRYKSGEGKQQKFTVTGEIDIYCDIHPTMEAKVKVVPSSLFAGPGGRTAVAADGSYRIDNVPAGTRQVVAWMPDSPEVQTRVTVTSGATATARDLNLQQGQPAARHTRRDGSSYPGYP